MISTASHHPALPDSCTDAPITGDPISEQMGKRIHEGLLPQAIIRDQNTFLHTADTTTATPLNRPVNANGTLVAAASHR